MTTTSGDSENLLTLPEVAEILRRTPRQLRWMRTQGTGPRSANLAGRIMYREGDVKQWIAEQFAAEEPGDERGTAVGA